MEHDVNKIRFLLASFMCFSPVKGKLYKYDKVAMNDSEIAKLLNIPVNEWMEVKSQVLEKYLYVNDIGAICLIKEFATKTEEIMAGISRIEDPEIQRKLSEIQGEFKKNLQPHQMLIEYYKQLKGIQKQTDWDSLFFRKWARIAKNTVEKIGLENAIQTIDWMNNRWKSWTLSGVLGAYPYMQKERLELLSHQRGTTKSKYLDE